MNLLYKCAFVKSSKGKNMGKNTVVLFLVTLFFNLCTLNAALPYFSTEDIPMSFSEFLTTFVPKVQKKEKQVGLASWILATTGSKDAATLKAELELEYNLLFHDHAIYEKLLAWDQDPTITDPLLKRQLNVLIRTFKPNLISKDLLKKITEEEANLYFLYANFRTNINGRTYTENEIREVLKNEDDVNKRKDVWEGSKEIGKVLAPHILHVVHLRNEAAKSLGYSDFFSMQLELQEVDQEWLFTTLEDLAEKSEEAYAQLLDEINESLALRFDVTKEEIGPWAWSEPYGQQDPLDAQELDELVKDLDFIPAVTEYYQKMNLDVVGVLNRSDNYERPGKNQHAFCTHIDREGDVRTLNNIKPNINWLETLFHELGHAVYELGFDPEMPWLLRKPPHMITTEAMALLMGRQAYRVKSLEQLGLVSDLSAKKKAEESLRRRQVIFSRWVLVMTYFESELYRNPDQDLNQLWWNLVEKYQKIKSSGSSHGCDWASKVHIGLAPVYYYSYLLGELFASTLEVKLVNMQSPESGAFLNEMLFRPADSLSWNDLIEYCTGEKLSPAAWLSQFTSNNQ